MNEKEIHQDNRLMDLENRLMLLEAWVSKLARIIKSNKLEEK